MHIYISGGCKNGKSHLAQRLAKALGRPLYYLATMIPADAEDEARVARHIADREGWGFETIECGRRILTALDGADSAGSFLLDSVTALLANEMFSPGGFDPSAPERVASELEEFVRRTGSAVLVSDFIFGDAAIYDEATEVYIAGLAHIDRRLAAACDALLEVSAGIPICHKGGDLLRAMVPGSAEARFGQQTN